MKELSDDESYALKNSILIDVFETEVSKIKNALEKEIGPIKEENKKLMDILTPASVPKGGYENTLALFLTGILNGNSDFISTLSVSEWGKLTNNMQTLYKKLPVDCKGSNESNVLCVLYNELDKLNKAKLPKKAEKKQVKKIQDDLGLSLDDLSDKQLQHIEIKGKDAKKKVKDRPSGKLSQLRK